MKRWSVFQWLIIVTVIIGLAFVLPQLVSRVQAESTQKQVETAISWQDVELLAKESNRSTETWLQGLREAGLYRVLLTDEEMARPDVVSLVTEAGLETAQVGGIPEGGRYLYAALYDEKGSPGLKPGLLYETDSPPQEQVLAALKETGGVLVLMENEAQTADILPEGWSLTGWDGEIVKCFRLTDYLRGRYQVLGYDGAEEIVNICFRSVVDRGMTMAWLSPFLDREGNTVTELAVYQDTLRQLENRLGAAGYSCGEAVPVPNLTLSPLSLAMMGVGVFALAVVVLCRVLSIEKGLVAVILFAVGVIESFGGAFAAPELQRSSLALLCALVFAAAAVMWMGRQLGKLGQWRQRWPLGSYLVTVVLAAAIALAGGLYVAAILGTRDYMLILSLFRGVKLSQLGVYLFALVWLAWVLLHRPGNRLREDGRALIAESRSHWKLKLLLLLLFFAAVCTVFILRGGDNMMSVSVLEQRGRNWLEATVFCRPRTKEFLIAWPALALACLCAVRGKRLFAWLFGVLASVGCASVINTFCHIRAHVLVSLARTGLGLLFGVILGLVLLLILGLLWSGDQEKTAQN